MTRCMPCGWNTQQSASNLQKKTVSHGVVSLRSMAVSLFALISIFQVEAWVVLLIVVCCKLGFRFTLTFPSEHTCKLPYNSPRNLAWGFHSSMFDGAVQSCKLQDVGVFVLLKPSLKSRKAQETVGSNEKKSAGLLRE